ncbi:MAG: hypothetical protein HC819_02835 [Cyclobacteriaceae bacterium]|nr:hypothetical protein [Cyclobacteriaceae bacterium]
MRKISISCGMVTFEAELLDTMTTRLMLAAMPLGGEANFWGDEIYFPVGFTAEVEENAKEEVELGTIGYWPPSKAFCMFFGPTPASTSTKPRGYSAVNICGQILGDFSKWRTISPGDKIKVNILE